MILPAEFQFHPCVFGPGNELGALLHVKLPEYRTVAVRFVFTVAPHGEVGAMGQSGQQAQVREFSGVAISAETSSGGWKAGRP